MRIVLASLATATLLAAWSRPVAGAITVTSTEYGKDEDVPNENKPDRKNCRNIVTNGDFEQLTLSPWINTFDTECEVILNTGTQAASPSGLTYPPIDDLADAVSFSKQAQDATPECRLSQDITFNTGINNTIVFAQLSWFDRINIQGNNFHQNQSAQIDIKVKNMYSTAETNIFTTTHGNTDTSSTGKTFSRVAVVTDLLNQMIQNNGNLELELELESRAFEWPLLFQWDNVQLWVCLEGSPPDPRGGGDPHFTLWNGGHYTFNGACDLVMLQSDSFSDGLGLDIHIRTKHRRDFSYISNAAIRIGDEVFEVDTSKNKKQATHYLNGVKDADLSSTISGFKILYKRMSEHSESYTIDLKNGEHIIIKTFKDFITIRIHENSSSTFTDSVGMMGDYTSGKLIGRDGVTVFDDADAYGQDWMVQPSDPVLFQTIGQSSKSGTCTMPSPILDNERRRRLGENKIGDVEAAEVCDTVPAEDRDFCIFDVISTQDLSMASVYAY